MSSERWSRGGLLVIASLAVAAMVVFVVGFTDLGWKVTGSSSNSTPPPAKGLSITFAVDSNSEVEFLLTTARPYIDQGDSFDIVSGSPENSSLSVNNVNKQAQELSSAFPGEAIYAHTAGITHYSQMVAGVNSDVLGVLYDYEPSFEPEFTLNFSQTLSSFQNVTSVAHAHGLVSVGYPIGRMLLNQSDQKYGWNYAILARTVDQLVIQVQTYCVDGPSKYASAFQTALDQYSVSGLRSVPTFQITIGNATTHLPNGVTATAAYECAQTLLSAGQHTAYIWFDTGGESNVITFLQDLGR